MSTAVSSAAAAEELLISPASLRAPRVVERVADAEPSPAKDRSAGGIFYGWLMVPLATLVMIASAPGQTYGFTFFNPWLRQSLSLSQTELATTYLLATLFAAAPLSFLGGMTDRLGLKRSMLSAVAAMAGACFLASAVQNAAMLFVACLAMRMIGAGVMTLLANNTLAAWFDRKLGLACSLMQLAGAAAVALVPVAMMALIAAVGWRYAYATQGVLLLAGLLPLVWALYREHPSELGQFPDGARLGLFRGEAIQAPASAGDGPAPWPALESSGGRSLNLAEALQTPIFWLLLSATSVWSLIGTGLVFHLDALLRARGLGTGETAWATPIMAITMAATQLVGGVLVDRVPMRRLIVTALACVAASCSILATAQGPAALAAYGVYGFGQGFMTVVSSASWARYFGPEHLGRIRGTSLTAAIASSALGPLVLGASFDLWGGFGPSLWLFVGTASLLGVGAAAVSGEKLAAPGER
jgi:MFS family permease